MVWLKTGRLLFTALVDATAIGVAVAEDDDGEDMEGWAGFRLGILFEAWIGTRDEGGNIAVSGWQSNDEDIVD